MGMGKRAGRMVALAVALCVAAGCASTTVIHSQPECAAVYIDNVKYGVTPLRYSDRALAWSSKSVRLEKAGYRPVQATIKKDSVATGPLLGSVLILPGLWAWGYPDEYSFELEPAAPPVEAAAQVPSL